MARVHHLCHVLVALRCLLHHLRVSRTRTQHRAGTSLRCGPGGVPQSVAARRRPRTSFGDATRMQIFFSFSLASTSSYLSERLVHPRKEGGRRTHTSGRNGECAVEARTPICEACRTHTPRNAPGLGSAGSPASTVARATERLLHALLRARQHVAARTHRAADEHRLPCELLDNTAGRRRGQGVGRGSDAAALETR